MPNRPTIDQVKTALEKQQSGQMHENSVAGSIIRSEKNNAFIFGYDPVYAQEVLDHALHELHVSLSVERSVSVNLFRLCWLKSHDSGDVEIFGVTDHACDDVVIDGQDIQMASCHSPVGHQLMRCGPADIIRHETLAWTVLEVEFLGGITERRQVLLHEQQRQLEEQQQKGKERKHAEEERARHEQSTFFARQEADRQRRQAELERERTREQSEQLERAERGANERLLDEVRRQAEIAQHEHAKQERVKREQEQQLVAQRQAALRQRRSERERREQLRANLSLFQRLRLSIDRQRLEKTRRDFITYEQATQKYQILSRDATDLLFELQVEVLISRCQISRDKEVRDIPSGAGTGSIMGGGLGMIFGGPIGAVIGALAGAALGAAMSNDSSAIMSRWDTLIEQINDLTRD